MNSTTRFTRRALVVLAGATLLATSSLAAEETALERIQKQGQR